MELRASISTAAGREFRETLLKIGCGRILPCTATTTSWTRRSIAPISRRYAPEPECPVIDHEFARVLVEYAEADEWGRRAKSPLIPPPICVKSFLERIVTSPVDGRGHAAAALPVGLDITGPGGGQWTVWMEGIGPCDSTGTAPAR